MATFDIGETVICSIEVKDDKGALKDPCTSMEITICNEAGKVCLARTTLTPDSIGKFHYDFQTSAMSKGYYTAKYIATDGARITIEKDTFTLE